MNLESRKKLLLQIVKNSGSLIAEHFFEISKHTMRSKSKHEIITSVDIEVESIILEDIRNGFPDDKILSEEIGGKKTIKGFLWIVDPLDGTTNFHIGNPVFTTSIGLAYEGELLLGATYHPILKQLFFVEKGKGFYLNRKKMTTSQTSNLSDAFIAFCHATDEESIKRISNIYARLKPLCRGLRQLGSASFELALVASGKLDAFIMPGVKPWDIAAGTLMVDETNGNNSDFRGQKWSLNSYDLLACNKNLKTQLISELKEF